MTPHIARLAASPSQPTPSHNPCTWTPLCLYSVVDDVDDVLMIGFLSSFRPLPLTARFNDGKVPVPKQNIFYFCSNSAERQCPLPNLLS